MGILGEWSWHDDWHIDKQANDMLPVRPTTVLKELTRALSSCPLCTEVWLGWRVRWEASVLTWWRAGPGWGHTLSVPSRLTTPSVMARSPEECLSPTLSSGTRWVSMQSQMQNGEGERVWSEVTKRNIRMVGVPEGWDCSHLLSRLSNAPKLYWYQFHTRYVLYLRLKLFQVAK